jgi:hypothetical protein
MVQHDVRTSGGHRARGWRGGGGRSRWAVVQRGWDLVLQRLHHGVNPSQGRKEKEAHRAWLHVAAHVGRRELAVACRRSGGGKSLSS